MRGDQGFGKFLSARHSALVRISRATRGECSIDDVKSEAYVLGADLAAATGRDPDFADTGFQEVLLARLYQRLVRYVEKNVRYAVRLDHAPTSRNGDVREPLIDRLVAAGADPLQDLVEAEEAAESMPVVNPHESSASAYVVLLRRFGNRMAAVARYLLISESHAYRRVARARFVRSHQESVATTLEETFLPRPWRRFRWYRIPVQLEFDFGERLTLEF